VRKAGFVAGKKVGKAVSRNRAKRLLRALFLSSIYDLAPGCFVFVAKAKILEEDYASVSAAFKNALKRSGALLSKR